MTNYDPRRQPALVLLVIGAIPGLILGLLIGWVFWPVEWTGGSLRDLNTAEKAEYIAAVADSFAIYDSPEAAAVAQRRLAPLDDGNLAQSFQETLAYFNASQFTDRAIRDSNIRRLAVALNLSAAGAAPAPQELVGDEAAATATSAPQVVTAPSTTETSSGLGWLGWLLWLVTALLLVGGGLYILSRTGLSELQTLFKRPAPAPDGIDEFEDQRAAAPHRGRTGGNLVTAEPEGPYSFDQEDDEWNVPPGRGAPEQSWREAPPRDDTAYRRPATQVYDAAYDEQDDEYDRQPPRNDRGLTDDDLEEDESDEAFLEPADDDLAQAPFDDDDDDGPPAGPPDRAGGSWRPARSSYTIDVDADDVSFGEKSRSSPERSQPTPPTTPPVDPRSTARRPPTTPNADSGQPSAALTSATFAPTRQAVSSVTSQRAPVAPPARSRATVIDQHVFQYQMGIAEYDESRPIVDPQTGKYIGEFGMGASSKNGLAQVGPDQLVALEVWLFDKSDERNLGNQTRILLSEYAIDHNLEQAFLKERQDNPRPFTAQRNVTFQLESQNLLLNCLIVDVKYSTNPATKGVFEQIKVDMTVQKKQ
ncbi:MAG: hypothetical protein DYG89_15990 [Caldilinea sp. CFX5]|nr:hypothetical protein [Caldilinea sp. CFX5]